jgi:hypothetical protein
MKSDGQSADFKMLFSVTLHQVFMMRALWSWIERIDSLYEGSHGDHERAVVLGVGASTVGNGRKQVTQRKFDNFRFS